MAASVAKRVPDVPRKMLAMKANGVALRGEGVRKDFADAESRRKFGLILSRALDHADLGAKAVSADMGYSDQSALSRWLSGADVPPLFVKLWFSSPKMQRAIVKAFAEAADNSACVVRESIEFPVEQDKAS